MVRNQLSVKSNKGAKRIGGAAPWEEGSIRRREQGSTMRVVRTVGHVWTTEGGLRPPLAFRGGAPLIATLSVKAR